MTEEARLLNKVDMIMIMLADLHNSYLSDERTLNLLLEHSKDSRTLAAKREGIAQSRIKLNDVIVAICNMT
jgi:hypothetical protein